MQVQKSQKRNSILAPLMVLSAAITLGGAAACLLTPQIVASAYGLDKGVDVDAPPIKGYFEVIDPRDTESFCNRGTVRWRIGDAEGAVEDFTMALKLARNNAEAYFGRGLAKLDLPNRKGTPDDETSTREKEKKAVEDFNLAIQCDPNNAEYYLERGRLLMGHDRQAGLSDFDKSISLDATNPAVFCARAYLRGMNLDTHGAIKDLDQAGKLDPRDAWIPFQRAGEMIVLEDREGARKYYDLAIKMDPDYSQAYLNRGCLRIEKGDKKGGLADIDKAISVAKWDPWPRQIRADYREKYGDKKGAFADRKEAAILERKLKEKEKRRKIRKFELVEDPLVYKFCADTLAKEQSIFGPARVPINRLYVYYRTGKSCQTIMINEKRGVFVICMANDKNIDVYYHSLAHELMHCINTRLADPFIEGLCCTFVEHIKPLAPERRKFSLWTKQYERGVVKIPFYRESYAMMKDLENQLTLNGISKILAYTAWNSSAQDWQHVDVDAWLDSLPADQRKQARSTVNRYANGIEKTLPQDGAYAFVRPKRPGPLRATTEAHADGS